MLAYIEMIANNQPGSRSYLAGIYYFLVIFALGFCLGAVRVVWLIPSLGETSALLIEIPIMLAAAWMVSKAIIQRLKLPQEFGVRSKMGGTALALLLVAEALLANVGFGENLHDYLDEYRTTNGAIGLLAQLLFGAIPILQK